MSKKSCPFSFIDSLYKNGIQKTENFESFTSFRVIKSTFNTSSPTLAVYEIYLLFRRINNFFSLYYFKEVQRQQRKEDRRQTPPKREGTKKI